jgi:hypothetical protein
MDGETKGRDVKEKWGEEENRNGRKEMKGRKKVK